MIKKYITPILLCLIIFLITIGSSYAGSVTLGWTANPEVDLAGYKVYYDIDAGPPYNGSTTIGGAQEGNSPVTVWLNGKRPLNNTFDLELVDNSDPEITLTIIDTTKDWYFVVTAFDDGTAESSYSNEVCTADYVPETPGAVYNIRISDSELKENLNDYGGYTGTTPLPSIVRNIRVLVQQ